MDVCLLSGLGAREAIPKLRCGLQKWFDVDALEEGAREQDDVLLLRRGQAYLCPSPLEPPKAKDRDMVNGGCLSERVRQPGS